MSSDSRSKHLFVQYIDVLWWICGRGKDFRSFVAYNRVGEIQSGTNPSQWQYVSTTENLTDLCTRGASSYQLGKDMTWGEGPVWLKESSEHWPKMKSEDQPKCIPERKDQKEQKGLATGITLHTQVTRTGRRREKC